MQTNRISEAQYAFLRDVRDGVVLLNELIEKHRLEDKRFSRWMRGVERRLRGRPFLPTGCWRQRSAGARNGRFARWKQTA